MHYITRSLLTASLVGGSLSAVAEPNLEEVVVTASRTETPLRQVGASVSVISEDDLQLQVAAPLAEALRTQAGVAVTNSGGTGKQSAVRIRGEESFRTLVLIDGVEMSDPTAPQVGTRFEDLQNGAEIQRVEILRGPQGFIYGADAGGVINILTRSPEDGTSGRVSVAGGDYGTRQLAGVLGAGNGTGDLLLVASDYHTDGLNTLEDDTSGETDGYDNTTLHAKAGWNLNNRSRAQLVARHVKGENFFDGCGYPTTNDCHANATQNIGRLSLDLKGDRFNNTFAYALTDVERDSFAGDSQTFNTSGRLHKAEYLGEFKLDDNTSAVFGSDYKTESIDVEGGDDLSRDQLGLFGELQAAFDDAVYLTAGARYDDNEDFGKHTSMRVSGAWLPVQGDVHTLKTRASIGTGFRAPSLQEIAYNQGDFAFGDAAATALKEETSKGIDLGIEHYWVISAERSWSAQLTLFDQRIENEIYFDLINFSGYLQADGESQSRGVEISTELQWNPLLLVYANATINNTETRDNQPRIRRPERLGNLGARLSLLARKLTLAANLRLVNGSENEIFGVGRVALDNYQVLDLSANWALGPVVLSGRVENAGDSNYQEVTGYNTAGRAFYLGLAYPF